MAQPNQPGNYPGIVVIQEAFGLVDHICDLARRFANIGYNACAPALYWRRGAPKDPDDMDTVFPVMFGLPDNEALQDLEAAADYLSAMPGATGKVGAIGFCSGGRHTLLFACSSSKVDAAIDCWGGFIHRATPGRRDQRRRVRKRRSTWSGSCIARCSACSAKRTRTRPSRSKPSSRSAPRRPGRMSRQRSTRMPATPSSPITGRATAKPPAHELWGDIQSYFGKHLKVGPGQAEALSPLAGRGRAGGRLPAEPSTYRPALAAAFPLPASGERDRVKG